MRHAATLALSVLLAPTPSFGQSSWIQNNAPAVWQAIQGELSKLQNQQRQPPPQQTQQYSQPSYSQPYQAPSVPPRQQRAQQSGADFSNPDLPPEHRHSNLLPQPKGGDMEMQVRQAYRHMKGGQFAERPSWLPSSQQDPHWCVDHTRTATAMNYCVAMQDREYIPSQQEYDQAIQQDMQVMKEARRRECITNHGTWTGSSCAP